MSREELRKCPPTSEDYEETREMLDDFGLRKVNVPTFGTYAQLEKWRVSILKGEIYV